MEEKERDQIDRNIGDAGAVSIALFLVMLLVYRLLGRFDLSVVLGGLIGLAAAMLNLLLLRNAVRDAVLADDQTVAAAKMRSSYSARMLGLVAATAAAYLIPQADALACIIALLFPRIGIMLIGFAEKLRK